MRTIANLLWIFIGGGIILFFFYIVGAFFQCLTIIGIPFGLQKVKLAIFALTPFGRQVISNSFASGCLGVLLNLLWILTGGIWIALLHFLLAGIFAITIIGLPFAKQHLKMSSLAIVPFGRQVVLK